MTAAEELRSCSAAVEQARSGLIEGTAAALDRCCDVLASAAERLGAARPSLDSARGEAEALALAWELRRDIRRAGALLENAAAYHAGWRNRVSVQTGGYGADGAPAQAMHSGRLWVRG